MSKIHLLQCPFECGDGDANDPYIVNDHRSYFVQCNYCEIQGSYGDSKEEAAENWNNRRSLNKTEDYLRGYYDCKQQFLKLIQHKLEAKERKEAQE